jgi:hypothetical protein
MKIERDSLGRLVVTTVDGQVHIGVTPVRAHPLSAPDEGVSLVGVDGHEVAWIERLDALDAATRDPIEAELAQREFMPLIHRLVAVSSFSTPSTWEVETDRGDTRFVLDGEENIRRLAQGQLLIAASHGVHFRVPDLRALDRASRRLIERFL